MAEYIEREKFRNILEAKAEMAFGTPKQVFYNTIAMLDLIPAADVVEVRHSKWIKGRKEKLYYNDDMSGFYDFPVTCSVCKFDITDEGFYETDYCPNCGAKMDGERRGD